MEYGYYGLDPESKDQYLLDGIRCDMLSTTVAAIKMHPNVYEKDFDAAVAFLTKYITREHQHQV